MLAERFSVQRGALFGFEPKANGSTGTLLKLYPANVTVKKTKPSSI